MSDRPTHRFGLVLDSADPEQLAVFWAAALDYVNVGSAGAYVALYPRDGNGPKLLLQQVDEAKTVKNACIWTSTRSTSKPKPTASYNSGPDGLPTTSAMSTAAGGL